MGTSKRGQPSPALVQEAKEDSAFDFSYSCFYWSYAMHVQLACIYILDV